VHLFPVQLDLQKQGQTVQHYYEASVTELAHMNEHCNLDLILNLPLTLLPDRPIMFTMFHGWDLAHSVARLL